MLYPIRKVKVGSKVMDVELYTPTPYEVIAEDFDYPAYIKNLIKEEIAQTGMASDEELYELFNMGRYQPETDPEKIRFNNKKEAARQAYCEQMLKLQTLYEKSLSNKWETKVPINDLMQELAQGYLEALTIITDNYERKRSSKQPILKGKVDSYQGVNRLVEKEFQRRRKKEQLQQESIKRIQAYHDGLLTPRELMGYDIKNLGEMDRVLKRGARKVIRSVFESIPNYEDYTMGELYEIYTNNKQNQVEISSESSKGKLR